jgi:hypothetical protein
MGMNDRGAPQGETEFERNARAMFEASIESLDAGTLSRLNQARNRALEAAAATRSRRRLWLQWAPAGALAASILAAALLLRTPVTDPTATLGATAAPAPVELLAAGEDLDIASEAELAFYEWIAADPAADAEVGG